MKYRYWRIIHRSQNKELRCKTEHSHLKDDDSVKIEKALCAMKERSITGLSKPLDVYAAESWTVTLERRC